MLPFMVNKDVYINMWLNLLTFLSGILSAFFHLEYSNNGIFDDVIITSPLFRENCRSFFEHDVYIFIRHEDSSNPHTAHTQEIT